MRYAAWLLLILVVSVSRTLAQGGDCPAIVDAALQTAADACTTLSRNQACYGNVTLQAEPQAGASFTFEQTGDIVDLVDVASLELSAMTEDAWGVALLLLQANLPDTLPGQNVTMVLFGEVAIASAVPTEPVVEPTPEPRPIVFIVTADSTINVRGGPSTSDAVVASLGAGETVPTDGRSDDGTWLHVRFDDGTTGWIFAELVSVDGDISCCP
ncbi:MAG: SH3 domain-containing protein [Anaerolineae bacterium]